MTPSNILELRQAARDAYVARLIKLQVASCLSGARGHHQLDGTLVTLQTSKDFEALVRASSVVFSTERYATATDVNRVFPHAVGHRVCVRSKPRDEMLASYVFGAAGRRTEEPAELQRTSREILKEILNEV